MRNRYGIALTTIFACLLLALPALAEESKENQNGLQEAHSLLKSKRYSSAYKHFHSLAKSGCPTSQCIVGLMHEHGVGVAKNGKQAIYWFEKAAAQNFADAELQLGKLYLYGSSAVKRDAFKARYWLAKAAGHGVAEAQYELGKDYVSNGGPQKVAEARRLLQSAVLNGYDDARALLAKLPQIPNNAPASNNPLATGVQNIEKSWEGYADVVKELASVEKDASQNH